jgi:hypothetical protein
MIPLKGNYVAPQTFESVKSTDEIWSNIIDVFAENGYSIKILDRESGYISTEQYSFINNYTMENKDSSPKDPTAWVVVGEYYTGMSQISPNWILGEWNIRIKEAAGKTQIKINLVNIRAGYDNTSWVFQAKSTGQFEKMMFEKIK